MHRLHEVLGVDDGPDLAVVVGGPVGLGHLGPALAGVDAVVVVLAVAAREPGLALLTEPKVKLEGLVGSRREFRVQVVLRVSLVLQKEVLQET